MRLFTVSSAALILFLSGPSLGAGEGAAPATPPAALDWTVGMRATASIEVLGPGGVSLRRTHGVVLGDPGRLVMRLTDLAGAEKVIATFDDSTRMAVTTGQSADSLARARKDSKSERKVEATAVYTFDAIQDIAVLETAAPLPAPPEPATAIKWRLNAKVRILPGPDMVRDAVEQTVTEPFEQGKVRVVPLSGDSPNGLAVMDVVGKWIGLTGRIEDASGKFTYLTSSEQIVPVLFGTPTGKPIAQIGATLPDWQNPREATGMLVRGVLRTFQKPAEAAPFFDLALQRDRTMPDVYFWMGKNAFKQQKYPDAEADFREAIRLRPDWATAYHMAGAAANQQGHYDVALDFYEKGLKIDPTNVMTMTNKAGALFNLGRIPESIEVLKKAIEIDPTYGLAIHNLGVTFSSMGNRVDAEAMYEKLKSIDKYLAKSLRDRLDAK